MGEPTSFVEDLVKQTCRRAAYEFEIGSNESNEEYPSIYSLEFLKSLHENPKENVQKLFRVPEYAKNGGSTSFNVFNLLNDTNFERIEKKCFLDFLNKVKDKEPHKGQQWSELRHYMHYVYRNFTCSEPDPTSEVLLSNFVNQMTELVANLMKDDESQLLLRIYGLLRDYCIYAHWNYCSRCENEQFSITKLFYYYETMLAAAKNLSTVFAEFDIILYKNYSVCWIDFNTCVFIHYFFETGYIQSRIHEFNRCKFTIPDSATMRGLLADLRRLWIREQRRVNKINDDALLDINSPFIETEAYTMEAHKKILQTDFWIERTSAEKESLNLDRLDHQIFRLVGDKTILFPDPIIDDTGSCVCEECLITKYQSLIETDPVLSIPNQRLISCHRCHRLICLDFFVSHYESHYQGNVLEKAAVFKVSRICGFEDFVKIRLADRVVMKKDSPKCLEPIPASEPPDFENGGNTAPDEMYKAVLNASRESSKTGTESDKGEKAIEDTSPQSEPGELPDSIPSSIPDDLDSSAKNPADLPDIQTNNDNTQENDDLDSVESENSQFHDDQTTSDDLDDVSPAVVTLDDEEFCNNDIDSNISSPDRSPSALLANTKAAFEEFFGNEKEEPPSSKAAFEELLKQRKNVRNFIKIKKDIFNHPSGSFGGKVYDNVFKHSNTTNLSKSCEISKESETKIRELLKQNQKTIPVAAAAATKAVAHKGQCEHNCNKHESEDLKAELKKAVCQARAACDHHKEKKCDCTYCEVFGTSVTSHTHKNNELRDRLRIRLHQRREKRTKDSSYHKTAAAKLKQGINKVEERVPPPVPAPPVVAPVAAEKIPEKSQQINDSDLHGLLNYIEGNSGTDKMAIAEKKAAKKLRQRVKKEEERLKIEEEQRKKVREAKRLEEEKRKAEEFLARQLAEKARISKLPPKRDSKKKNKNNRNNKQDKQLETKVVEETIPAMVTIKRVVENENAPPTVTITLKGSTPDQDKLLYTLVNGSDGKNENGEDSKKNKNQKIEPATKNNNKKKKNKADENSTQQSNNNNNIISKELKVTLALDPSTKSDSKKRRKQLEKAANLLLKKNDMKPVQDNKKDLKRKEENISLPMLRLPPGITITKVEGPVSNRNYKATNLQDQPQGSTINVSKSGVIVVDTEKLIQQTNENNSTTLTTTSTKTKKSRRKKNKKVDESSSQNNGQQMITLKNPIFQNMPSNNKPEPAERVTSTSDGQCAPAAIFTSENGMVTIRSSRLQQSFSSGVGMAMPSLLSDLKPVVGPDVPNSFMPSSYNASEPKKMSAFNAQEILSGLPGIEITKVDKRTSKSVLDSNKSCQTAQVSIIPAGNDNKFNLEKDDWTYDSVFTPKDILEDDMDADERELEAFKRFCQQSVPPKRKEKVAHLNVKDIVLKKKNDANCV